MPLPRPLHVRLGDSTGKVPRRISSTALLRKMVSSDTGGVEDTASPQAYQWAESLSADVLMAKPCQPNDPSKPPGLRVLPVQLRLGDQLTDETGSYVVIGKPYMTVGGKTANVRVKRAESDVTMIRI